MKNEQRIENTACFTGHRSIRQEDKAMMDKWLNDTIGTLIEKGIVYFMCGGALGFDTCAAKKVLELKEKRYPEIQLVLALPCLDQTARWQEGEKNLYESIKARADEVVYVSERNYYDGCMQIRNRFMVDSSCITVYYLHQKWGGTAQTKNYAKEQGKLLLNVIINRFDT